VSEKDDSVTSAGSMYLASNIFVCGGMTPSYSFVPTCVAPTAHPFDSSVTGQSTLPTMTYGIPIDTHSNSSPSFLRKHLQTLNLPQGLPTAFSILSALHTPKTQGKPRKPSNTIFLDVDLSKCCRFGQWWSTMEWLWTSTRCRHAASRYANISST